MSDMCIKTAVVPVCGLVDAGTTNELPLTLLEPSQKQRAIKSLARKMKLGRSSLQIRSQRRLVITDHLFFSL